MGAVDGAQDGRSVVAFASPFDDNLIEYMRLLANKCVISGGPCCAMATLYVLMKCSAEIHLNF